MGGGDRDTGGLLAGGASRACGPPRPRGRICFLSGLLALWLIQRFNGPDKVVQQVLSGTLVRMSLAAGGSFGRTPLWWHTGGSGICVLHSCLLLDHISCGDDVDRWALVQAANGVADRLDYRHGNGPSTYDGAPCRVRVDAHSGRWCVGVKHGHERGTRSAVSGILDGARQRRGLFSRSASFTSDETGHIKVPQLRDRNRRQSSRSRRVSRRLTRSSRSSPWTLKVTKFMVLEVVGALILIAIFVPLARRSRVREPPLGAASGICLEAMVVFIRDQVARPDDRLARRRSLHAVSADDLLLCPDLQSAGFGSLGRLPDRSVGDHRRTWP